MGKDIGEKVRKIRQKMRLSQSELARKAGIAQSTLSYIESGRKAPQFDTLSSICKGLGISVLQLLAHDEPKADKKLFEQEKADLEASQEQFAFTFPEGLPEDALIELLEFQKYIEYKYGPYTKKSSFS